ncbi:MAG: phytoene/squalene synthase family protein [Candidatus Omnitrophica bacterium]|nr:phytoene/squalene synthase family protein [Candidatus Omnitrophota bacterium]
MNPPTPQIEQAYAECEAIVKKRESNFSLGFSVLPVGRRRAIHVVYAFCRFVDDISDEVKAAGVEAMLAEWVGELDRIYGAGDPVHPIGIALRDVLRSYPIPREGIQELIDGCVQDQSVKRCADFAALTEYCELVATSIAKVSLPVYGWNKDAGVFGYARDLSFAFQLTNVLRDIAEDLERGRVYVPEEDWKRFGLTPEEAVRGGQPDAFGELVRFEAARCEDYFERGRRVIECLDPESRPCVRAMWGAYHTILEKIVADPSRSLRERAGLTAEDKSRILGESVHE